MSWYGGAPLLYHLAHVVIAPARNLADVRFPVQWVIRPMSDEHHDYRGYVGQVAGGVLRPGAEVMVLPSGRRSRIAAIDTYDGELDAAFPTMSVTVRVEDHLDISRGDMFVDPADPPSAAGDFEAMVCWMSERPLLPEARYVIKHTTRSVRAVVADLEHRVDVNTLEHVPADQLGLNEIGRVRLRASAPLMLDSYARNRTTGSFILIDETTNDTVAGGMVLDAK
jgi:sulfate adenylyltransferase subunit 1 (EFTu-like GTPase family)